MLKLAAAQNNMLHMMKCHYCICYCAINKSISTKYPWFFSQSVVPSSFLSPCVSGVWLQPPLTLSGFSGLIGCKLASCYESWRGRRSESHWLVLQLNCSWGKNPCWGWGWGDRWWPKEVKAEVLSCRNWSAAATEEGTQTPTQVSTRSQACVYVNFSLLWQFFAVFFCIFPLLEGFRNHLKDQN